MIAYCLAVWFFFYLFNHADLFRAQRERMIPQLPPDLAYAIQCSFCACFYVTLVCAATGFVPVSYLLSAPPVSLFIDLAFRRLRA